MGMFTEIIHPETGAKLQIKCGWDDLDCYSLGDVVDHWHRPDSPGSGKLADDVYDAVTEFGAESADYWVVIKGHTVHAIEPMLCRLPDADINWGDEFLLMRKKYDVWGFAHDLWTEYQWQEHYNARQKSHDEYEAKIRAKMETSGCSRLEAAGGIYMEHMLKGPSFMEQILPAEQIGE
jgi:hypothetical protein